MFAKRSLLVSVGLICLSYRPSAATEPPPQFVTQWGLGPGTIRAVSKPWGCAVDAAGYVYVADQWNFRVFKFTDTGQFVLSWGSYGGPDIDPNDYGHGQFDIPTGVGADAAGRIFVADWSCNRVQTFTSEGAFVSEFNSSAYGTMSDVTVGATGMVYVANGGHGQVESYDSNGSFLGTVGVGIHPNGVAVDVAGNILVSDSETMVIYKFDPAGNLLMTFGGRGTEPGSFVWPVGIAIDWAGNVYVADAGNNRVQKFSPDGALLSYWGTFGNGPGQFNSPLDVAIGPDGSIYVTDARGVQKFGYGPTPVQSVTWGGMKARYRGERRAAGASE